MVNTVANLGAQDWKKMKVQELRDELASRGLDTTGLKAALIERLEATVAADTKEGEAKEEGEAKKGMEIDMNEKVAGDDCVEKSELNKTTDGKPSTEKDAEAGSEARADAKPVAAVVDAANGATEEASVVPSEPAAQVSGKSLTTDLERKQKRAERFGLELKVSEVEKKRLRAERFGGSPTNGTDKSSDKISTNKEKEVSKMSPTVKEMEAVKRKARAERFGIEVVAEKPAVGAHVIPAAPASLDDAKKKARLARFGLTIKLDPQEQEKKKLRAARFGLDTGDDTKVKATAKVAVTPPAAS